MTWWGLKAIWRGARGGPQGATAPCRKPLTPCVGRNFGSLLEEIWQNDVQKLHFFAISTPVGSSCPPSEDFWRHPYLKVDLSLKFQEVFTTQIAHGNFNKAVDCMVFPWYHEIVLKIFTKKNAYAMVGDKQIEGVSCK